MKAFSNHASRLLASHAMKDKSGTFVTIVGRAEPVIMMFQWIVN